MSGKNWQDDFARARAAKAVNVVCMKWGTLYGPEWVNRLYGMVARNTTWNVRFVCFTDDRTGIRKEVETLPIPEVASIPSSASAGRSSDCSRRNSAASRA